MNIKLNFTGDKINKMRKTKNFRNIVKKKLQVGSYTHIVEIELYILYLILKDILSDNFKNAIKVKKIFYKEQILDENFDIYIFQRTIMVSPPEYSRFVYVLWREICVRSFLFFSTLLSSVSLHLSQKPRACNVS